jgi:hypothetical protein
VIAGAVEEDELLRVFHRQYAQEDLVHQREDGSVGPDAERDRQQGHRREHRRPHQAARRVLKISNQLSHSASPYPRISRYS